MFVRTEDPHGILDSPGYSASQTIRLKPGADNPRAVDLMNIPLLLGKKTNQSLVQEQLLDFCSSLQTPAESIPHFLLETLLVWLLLVSVK